MGLKYIFADAVWRASRMCWIDVYLGPPDVVTHDAGLHFMNHVIQKNAELIETKAVLVESASSMTFVKIYYCPLRRAFNIMENGDPD